MFEKMIRAARLDTSVYNEVERDENETSNALIVVVLVALVGAVGLLFSVGVGGALAGILSTVLGWVAWAFMIYFIGTRVFNATATPGEVLRTTGYAQAPALLNILGVIPILGALVGFIVWIWTLVTMFIAAREALDLDNTKTFITVVLGFIAFVVISVILGIVFGITGLGLNMLFGR